MIAIDTVAAQASGPVGTVNSVLNGVLGLYVVVQTLARFIPTLKDSEINSWAGKILHYVFLYSKTYTKSESGMDSQAGAQQPDAQAYVEQSAQDAVPEQPVQQSADYDSAMRAISAAAETVVAVAAVVQKRAHDEAV